MTVVPTEFRWGVWVEWPARTDWTARDTAERLLDSVRAAAEAFPGRIPSFRVEAEGPEWTPDQTDAFDRLTAAVRQRAPGEALVQLYPPGGKGPSIVLEQSGAGSTGFGRLKVDFYRPAGAALTRDPAAVATLVTRLAAVWSARNAWVDMVHVRQKWVRWALGRPVYGWATWLRDDFATVDTTGIDVDVVPGAGGVLLTLRVDPGAMADRSDDTGRATIEELVRRTHLA